LKLTSPDNKKPRPEGKPKKIIEQIPYEKKNKKLETISIDQGDKEVNIKTDEFKDISKINVAEMNNEAGEINNDIFKEIADDMYKNEEEEYDDFEKVEENKLDIIKEESLDKREKEKSVNYDISRLSKPINDNLLEELEDVDIEEEVKISEPKNIDRGQLRLNTEKGIENQRGQNRFSLEAKDFVVTASQKSLNKFIEAKDVNNVEESIHNFKENTNTYSHQHSRHHSHQDSINIRVFKRNRTTESQKSGHSQKRLTIKSKALNTEPEIEPESTEPVIAFYNNDIESLTKNYIQYLTQINKEQMVTFKIQHNIYEYIKGFNPKVLIETTQGNITSMCFLSYDTTYEFALRLVINHFSTTEYNDIESKFSKFIQFILEHFLLDELYIDLHYLNEGGSFTINTYIRDILKNKLSFKWSKLEHRHNERYQKMYIKNPKVTTSMDVQKIKQFRQLISMENITLINYENKQNIMVNSTYVSKHAEKKINVFPVIYSLTNLREEYNVEGGIVDAIQPDVIRVILF
jgi:hypothetical protein